MKRAITGVASLLAVGALAGGLFVGSQAIRQARLATADVVSPSPSDSPTYVPNPPPIELPSCAPGEGNSCASPSPIALPPPPSPAPPAATPNDTSAGTTTGPSGQIQASFVTFSTGQKLGVSVAVLDQSSWVIGASVSVHCTAAGWSDGASGTTALRSSWSVPANGPRPPTQPGAFFWAQISGPGTGQRYTCTGSASYNGLSTTFSVTGTA